MTAVVAIIALAVTTVASLGVTVFVFLRFAELQEKLVKTTLVEQTQKLAVLESVERRVAERAKRPKTTPVETEYWGRYPMSGNPE